MKKHIVFLLFTCLVKFGFAQDTDITAKENSQNAKAINIPRMGFSLEPLAGIGTSEAVQHGTNNLGWKAGCGVAYMLNEHWGVSSGLQVEKYSTNFVSGKDSEYISGQYEPSPPFSYWYIRSVNVTYNLTYLELPIMLRYISSHAQKFGFFVEAGFIVGYLISSRESDSIFNESIGTNGTTFATAQNGNVSEQSGWQSLPQVTPKAAILNLEGHLTIGFFIPISQICSIISDVSINKGFTNVGNSSSDYLNYNGLLYYYNNNVTSSNVSNYGSNFSFLFSIRLSIKLNALTLKAMKKWLLTKNNED